MSELENKVDHWQHQNLQEEVWELQHQLNRLQDDFNWLREEFLEFRKSITDDGK
jgi:uncharacterized coiled-coil protein SlyX